LAVLAENDMQGKITRIIKDALKNLAVAECDFAVEHPDDIKNGDYFSNVALVCGKIAKINPKELAEKIKLELDGKIKVKDLPKIWNEKMREITGKYPKNNAEGVLQDVHWSSGYFGYFPTYAIGTIYAAQIFNSLKKKYPDIEDDITAGDYTKIREWLIKNIHSKGSLYLAEEIIRQCCGEGLNPEAYIEYLTTKYREIYKF